jgi:23S rRNA (adenine2030-N6)-methyltransferase
MEYNHSRKAGNQGDVWKHAVLVTLADSVAGKSDAFQYVESHCGSPVHELTRGGEWERGIGRLVDKGSCDCLYATIARSWLKRSLYPAGWLLVANRLAARFTRVRAVLADVAELVASHYPPSADVAVAPNVHVEFHLEDGYSVAASLERADLVFLDPPFYPDADADWRKLAETCLILAERDVPFVAWYPFYWHTRPQWLVDTTRCQAWEVAWAPCGPKPSQNLKGCGMLGSPSIVLALQHDRQELQRVSYCLGSEFRVRYPNTI